MDASEVRPAAACWKPSGLNSLGRCRCIHPGGLVATTLMRHAGIVCLLFEPSQSPPSSTGSMGAAPAFGALVAVGCRTLGLSPAGGRTGLAAIALAAVTSTAQQTLQTAASTHQQPRGALRVRGAGPVRRR